MAVPLHQRGVAALRVEPRAGEPLGHPGRRGRARRAPPQLEDGPPLRE